MGPYAGGHAAREVHPLSFPVGAHEQAASIQRRHLRQRYHNVVRTQWAQYHRDGRASRCVATKAKSSRPLIRSAAFRVHLRQGQPRRQDLHYTEAVGHFHLYPCSITPEFPTGNGKVDLVLRSKNHLAVIEVKSFVSVPQMAAYRNTGRGIRQKARPYASDARRLCAHRSRRPLGHVIE